MILFGLDSLSMVEDMEGEVAFGEVQGEELAMVSGDLEVVEALEGQQVNILFLPKTT